MANLTNYEKSVIYDNLLRESEVLHRAVSKIKSEFVGNIPPHKENEIRELMRRDEILVRKLNDLFY